MQLSYHEIWQGLENLAASRGLSLSGLATKAGLDPTSFNKSKRIGLDGRKRWPSTESMNKVFQAMNITVFEFMELAGVPCPKTKHTIPLLGLVKAGREGYFDTDGNPILSDDWDGIEFPYSDSKSIYALEVSGDSMVPLYRAGDKLVVSPEAEVRQKDRVVVKLRSGEVMVKELAHKSAKQIELRSLNANYEPIIVAPEDVCWMARVLWVSQ